MTQDSPAGKAGRRWRHGRKRLDGKRQGVRALSSRHRSWVAGAIAQLQRGEALFVSAHVDDVGLPWKTWRDAEAALLTTAEVIPHSWDGRLAVNLPLRDTRRIMTRVPNAPESKASPIVPPGIYLFSRAYYVEVQGESEEHRAHIDLPELAEGIMAEFSSFRSDDSRMIADGFSNSIWLSLAPGRFGPTAEII